jgi:hypothetical protein
MHAQLLLIREKNHIVVFITGVPEANINFCLPINFQVLPQDQKRARGRGTAAEMHR